MLLFIIVRSRCEFHIERKKTCLPRSQGHEQGRPLSCRPPSLQLAPHYLQRVASPNYAIEPNPASISVIFYREKDGIPDVVVYFG